MMIREQEHISGKHEGVVSAAITNSKDLSSNNTLVENESDQISHTNIVIGEAQFEKNKNGVSQSQNRLSASDSDFLNQLDAELRQTEQNVREMNNRFNK